MTSPAGWPSAGIRSEPCDCAVLVGHSLGGLLVQKYMERHPARGAVLMASIPPGGTIGAITRLAVRHPMLFFTPQTPRELVDSCDTHLQDESYLAFLGTAAVLARPRRVRVPVLVLGAEGTGSSPLARCAEPHAPTGRRRRSLLAWATT